jgi:hypothetical protein
MSLLRRLAVVGLSVFATVGAGWTWDRAHF